MASQAQIAASRANGKKSKGPKTSQGRMIASMNALVHGRRSKRVALLRDESFNFESRRCKWMGSEDPRTDMAEFLLAQNVATSLLWGEGRGELLPQPALLPEDGEEAALDQRHDFSDAGAGESPRGQSAADAVAEPGDEMSEQDENSQNVTNEPELDENVNIKNIEGAVEVTTNSDVDSGLDSLARTSCAVSVVSGPLSVDPRGSRTVAAQTAEDGYDSPIRDSNGDILAPIPTGDEFPGPQYARSP